MDKVSWTMNDTRITVSLPPSDAEWANGGTRGMWRVPPTHEGRGPEAPALPEEGGMSAVELGMLGKGL